MGLARRQLHISRAQLRANKHWRLLTSLSRRSRGTWRIWKRIRISRASHSNSAKSQDRKEIERSIQPWLGTIGRKRCQVTYTAKTSEEQTYTTMCCEQLWTEFTDLGRCCWRKPPPIYETDSPGRHTSQKSYPKILAQFFWYEIWLLNF